MSNSPVMLRQLGKRCDHSHTHQHLVGNRCKDAAFYPVPLVKAILRGITLHAQGTRAMNEKEEKSISALSMPISAMPMTSSHNVKEEFGPANFSSVPKMNGGQIPIVRGHANFKEKYAD